MRSSILAFLLLLAPSLVAAQPLGTFRWQLQPYCNIVTATVVLNDSVFTLDGFDDQCGAGPRGAVTGTAFPNPDGSFGIGLTVVTAPSGTPLHVDITLNLATLGGPWRDSAGANGSFVFTPGGGTGGSPRPASTLGLSGVTLGYGLAGSGPPGATTLQVNIDQIRSGLDIRVPVESLGIGDNALGQMIDGAAYNTALGSQALAALTSAGGNTAVGARALQFTTASAANTAVGTYAMHEHLTGNYNVAVGFQALSTAETGSDNVAIGENAARNLAGNRNVVIGRSSLAGGRNSARNVIIGTVAVGLAQGDDNVVIGDGAGSAAPFNATLANNIYIGNPGLAASESNTIRIGKSTHTRAFLAGVSGATSASGVAVYVNANGQLGTATSSARFKTDIAPLTDEARRIQALAPVRFTYKPEYDDGAHQVQFGLLAEDVAATFPELVARDEDGRPWSVRYHLLTPLLLAEVQRLEKARAALAEESSALRDELAALRTRLAQLEARPR